jgi:hypothetical protein
MKQIIFLVLLVSSTIISAEDSKKENKWNGSSLTDATIKKIQQSQYEYKKCVTDEMKKPGYFKIDSRNATDAIIKQCESVLAKMRQVYIGVKVPSVITDRHLKKMRMDITRRVLKQMIFVEAARKSK